MGPGALQELRVRVAEELARAIVHGAHDTAMDLSHLLITIHCQLDGSSPPVTVIGHPPARAMGRCSGCGVGVEFRTAGCRTCTARALKREKRRARQAV